MEIPIDERHLAQLAANTARTLCFKGRRRPRRAGGQSLDALREAGNFRRRAAVWAAKQECPPAEVEWLLDNWYLAEQTALQDSRRFRRERLPIPVVVSGDGPEPYILALAKALAGTGELTERRLALFLESAQKERPLEELELSLFPSALGVALTQRLALLCRELEPLLEGEAAEEAAGKPEAGLELKMKELFTSLRLLSSANLGDLLEEQSRVERLLRKDPSGEYPKMDARTRREYRSAVCRIARREKRSETEVAGQALRLAGERTGAEGHVGWYLLREPLGKRPQKAEGVLYVGAILLPTLFLSLFAAFRLDAPAIVPLLLLPLSDLVKGCVDFLTVRLVHPRPVCRMALEEGIPAEGRTLCVIASLLTGEGSGKKLAGQLELYRLANRDAGKELLFGILADLPDSAAPMGEEGRRAAEAARRAVEELNQTYGGGFFLFFRPPVFQSRDERYMGWERKRGAILELCRLLRKRSAAVEVLAGEKERLEGVQYVITLDSDTELTVGAAKELTGAMLHPLNRPRLDPRRRIVTGGYGILQPKIDTSLSAARRSRFASLLAGRGGVDPYGCPFSDISHDLFDQGTYTGKGILDVDAFLLCLDRRFPVNRVLSHDLLEGSYLHAGLIGDVELTDSVPYQATAYYARLHRWVRGDWQLLPWLGKWVRCQDGQKEKNPLSPVARWKIFDNLRRSLSPVGTLAALLAGMCLPGKEFALAAGTAAVAVASGPLMSEAELLLRGGMAGRVRYYSHIAAGLGAAALQTLVRLLFLPYEAWICLSAAVTALWRSFFTHRRMLSWVTAADEERRDRGSLGSHIRREWSAVAIGVWAILFSRLPAGAGAGLIWIASPIFSWALGRPYRGEGDLGAADRAFLHHEAALIWRFFADHLTAEDHYLPPDNVQEQPDVGIARRTSPTNIGMAMLSIMSAVDLELLPRDRGRALLACMLDTVEALPKQRGHLYNWYDTASAKPLYPRYISTVDSGNFCACLIALEEGLSQWGEGELARRCRALWKGTDLPWLYDEKKRLFYIGFDAEREEYTRGWYDLMASEARLTSYVAVACGAVERRHWRSLGRMLLREGDHMGMASWTGTMFEYFMPNLLLPCEPGSLHYESLAFCLGAQRRRTAGTKAPWGISESCFYAFDGGLNYQYKAHGVQALALKRGMDDELVVAPYASFLALVLAPRRAVKNLRRLRGLGLEGRYGFYEAADFTPSRRIGAASFEPICTYMAHHLGMSLVAIDNALGENVMQRRFMAGRTMEAYRELLQEKVPMGAQAIRREEYTPPGERRRRRSAPFVREGTLSSGTPPECHLVSNGTYSVFCTESGLTASKLGDTLLTLACTGESFAPAGITFLLKEKSGALFPLLKGNDPNFRGGQTWRFTGGGAEWKVSYPSFTARSSLKVVPKERGEVRELVITCLGERLEGEAAVYLEPVLAPFTDYTAHPAFSKLSLVSKALSPGVLFTRRPREAGERTAALAVLWDRWEGAFDTSRERALGRGGLRGISAALERPAGTTAGAVQDPCLLARFPVRLQRGERFRLRISLGASEGAEEAEETARRLLLPQKGEQRSYWDALMLSGHMTADNALQALRLLGYLAFPARWKRGEKEWKRGEKEPSQQGLWPYGISGDIPIAACPLEREERQEDLLESLRAYRLLTACGFSFDLVYLLSDGGDYRRPVRTALMEDIKKLGLEWRLSARGGIHLVDASQAAGPILAAAAVEWRPGRPWPERGEDCDAACSGLGEVSLEEGEPEWQFDPEGSVIVWAGRRLPRVGWSHILANSRFGWITDETGCGHLWYLNARENQLTAWNNDPLSCGGPERLLVERDGKRYSLFADGDGFPCRVTYGFGYARWEKTWTQGRKTCVTAFVPPDAPGRILTVAFEGEWSKERLLYAITPQMGPSRKTGRFCEITEGEGAFSVRNPWNTAFSGQCMTICPSRPWEEWRQTAEGELQAVFPVSDPLTLTVGCAASAEERRLLRRLRKAPAEGELSACRSWWEDRVKRLTVQTPDRELDWYLNGWCAYQIIACRLFARTSRYQCGGAFGFRDQLQDVCALIPLAPELAREQILRECACQFSEGDVQHWWHPTLEEGAHPGVRTRISDDLLWLPYALCEYVEKTGDLSLLDEPVSFLRTAPLGEEEGSRYEKPEIASEQGSVYDHACRAVDCHLHRGTGSHGLAKIGTGDWNDGMDKVGREGRGESVWLSWFAAHVLRRFSAVAESRGERDRGALWRERAAQYVRAADNAWDGDWFLRGYFDNGAPLGGKECRECRIDSLAQSWAALAPEICRERAKRAVESALTLLTEEEGRLVKLLDPAFDGHGPDPGYIRGYPQGVRENGGQYTHAAVWLALACFRLGMTEEGAHTLKLLLPSGRGASYRAEPYVLAADVCAAPNCFGQGGWSWYTGAAGWYLRVSVEELLGLRLENGRLLIRPSLPAAWKGYSADWRTEKALLHIQVDKAGKRAVLLDGDEVQEGIPLDGLAGEHTVRVLI